MGYGKSYILVGNRVRVFRTGRHTRTQKHYEYLPPPPPPTGDTQPYTLIQIPTIGSQLLCPLEPMTSAAYTLLNSATKRNNAVKEATWIFNLNSVNNGDENMEQTLNNSYNQLITRLMAKLQQKLTVFGGPRNFTAHRSVSLGIESQHANVVLGKFLQALQG